MTISFEPIGIIHTPFHDITGVPIQPRMAAPDIKGWIDLLPAYQEGLSDLEGFDRIWLIFHLHEAKKFHLHVTPFLDSTKKGLFATRAPSRPNGIGLSCVRLLNIQGTRIEIAEMDIVDNTPLLDIKPYSPRFDAYPNVRSGWLDHIKERESRSKKADDRFKT